MRFSTFMPIALVALLALPGVRADSLWMRRTPKGGFLFVDDRARQPGDLLTIVVQETTGINHQETRDATKTTNTEGVFNLAATTTGNINSKTANAAVDVSGGATRLLNGTSQFTSDRSFADRMTVTVIGVMPNGNLVIEGMRIRVVSGETRTLRVSGVVRPDDVGANNTVGSQYIANFRVTYEGKGQESHFTSQGWFNKIMNHLWPF
jgi:flagellar L-ring protein precursor FlgH